MKCHVFRTYFAACRKRRSGAGLIQDGKPRLKEGLRVGAFGMGFPTALSKRAANRFIHGISSTPTRSPEGESGFRSHSDTVTKSSGPRHCNVVNRVYLTVEPGPRMLTMWRLHA